MPVKEQVASVADERPVAHPETYVKPEVKAQPLDEVVRGGGGYSGDYPGFVGGEG